jgi:hypothetical protein
MGAAAIEKDVLLTADLFSLIQAGEWQTLEGQPTAVGTTAEPAPGAGKFAYSQLYNPPGSGVFLAGIWVAASFSSAQMAEIRRFDTSLADAPGVWSALSVGTKAWVDFRTAGQPAAVVQSRVNTAAALIGSSYFRQRYLASTLPPWPSNGMQLVLPPGAGFLAVHSLANNLCEAAWTWREVVITNDYADEPIRTLLAERRRWGLL